MKEFFIRLFEKSIEKNCEVKLPVDFQCSEKATLEEIVKATQLELAGDGAQETMKSADQKDETKESKKSIPEQNAKLDVSEIQKVEGN